jgi:hypothetical protein
LDFEPVAHDFLKQLTLRACHKLRLSLLVAGHKATDSFSRGWNLACASSQIRDRQPQGTFGSRQRKVAEQVLRVPQVCVVPPFFLPARFHERPDKPLAILILMKNILELICAIHHMPPCARISYAQRPRRDQTSY